MSDQEVRHRTYKREVACVLLAGFSGIVFLGDIEMVKVLVWPVVGFAAAAFGLDAVGSQWKAR